MLWEAGIFNQLRDEAIEATPRYDRSSESREDSFSSGSKNDSRSISLDHLKTIFYFLFICVITSVAVIVVEAMFNLRRRGRILEGRGELKLRRMRPSRLKPRRLGSESPVDGSWSDSVIELEAFTPTN